MPPETKRLKSAALNLSGGLALLHATLDQAPEDGASDELNIRVRSVAEIYMLVTSIDPLAPYKVSHDLLLDRILIKSTSLVLGPSRFVRETPRINPRSENVTLRSTPAKAATFAMVSEISLFELLDVNTAYYRAMAATIVHNHADLLPLSLPATTRSPIAVASC